MNVVSMRMEQKVAYVSPRALSSRPGPKELYRITEWLGPATPRLQTFVQLPTQIVLPFVIQNRAACIQIAGTRNKMLCFVPTPFPNIQPYAANRIYIRGSPNFVMTEDAGLEENANFLSVRGVHFSPETIKDLFQLARERRCDQRVTWGRLDAKGISRTNRHSNAAVPARSHKIIRVQ
jgi:hypothetical protein